jgi:hypothetical protein
MNTPISKTALGIVIANIFATTTIGISKYLIYTYLDHINNGADSTLIFSDFVIIPIVMGLITAWYWKDTGMGGWTQVGYSCINCLVGLFMSAIFLGEGVMCLLIVSPLVLIFILIGVFVGRLIFKRKNNTMNISVFSLLFMIFISDTLSHHSYENMVSDTIIIHAKPDSIWRHVVAFDSIQEPPHYWLFKIGMPCPKASIVDGYYEGAGRKCIFSNGYTFDERISVYKPGDDLVFDITNQPRDPEIMGHIDLVRGEFKLKDNGDGTTTLTGNSWYKLYVFPTWYYDIWAVSLVRNVHTRVMENIKKLSERN